MLDVPVPRFSRAFFRTAILAGVSISAGAGNNTITGGAGDDSITLGAGIDNIRGGGGNDVVRGNLSVGDRVLLDGGDDTITLPTTAIAHILRQ